MFEGLGFSFPRAQSLFPSDSREGWQGWHGVPSQ